MEQLLNLVLWNCSVPQSTIVVRDFIPGGSRCFSNIELERTQT